MRAALLCLFLSACAASVVVGRPTVVDRAPPSPPAASLEPGPAPYPGATWIGGHWTWDGLQFVWEDGYWIDGSGHSVRQPSWSERDGSWTYDAGALVASDGSTRALPPPPRGGLSARGTIVVVPTD